MTVRLVLVAIFLAAGIRSAYQGWNSYRRRQVRVSLFAGESITREAQPGVYWPALVLHSLLVATFFGIAVALAVGLARHSA